LWPLEYVCSRLHIQAPSHPLTQSLQAVRPQYWSSSPCGLPNMSALAFISRLRSILLPSPYKQCGRNTGLLALVASRISLLSPSHPGSVPPSYPVPTSRRPQYWSSSPCGLPNMSALAFTSRLRSILLPSPYNQCDRSTGLLALVASRIYLLSPSHPGSVLPSCPISLGFVLLKCVVGGQTTHTLFSLRVYALVASRTTAWKGYLKCPRNTNIKVISLPYAQYHICNKNFEACLNALSYYMSCTYYPPE
jgi:hypothetical protein